MNTEETKKSSPQLNATAILAVLVFSAFIALFNETILNVALNTLMDEMKVTGATIQWLVTVYMIVVSVMVPVTAFLIQTFEIKKLFLGAMSILLLGTIGAACSGTFVMLLISRMIQAMGTGMMIPIMMNTVLLVTPPKKRGSAMGICVCAIQLGPALGPTFSGLILQFLSWHALFIILIPVIVLAMVLGNRYLVNVAELTRPKIDIASIILSTLGVGGIIYGLSSFGGDGNMKIAMVIFVIGILSLIIFIRRQLILEEPMLEMRTFKYPVFSIGVVLVMLSMMTIFTMNVMLPMYLQGALLKATFISAIVLLPATLSNGVVTLISGRIYDKIGAKKLVPTGFFILVVSLFIMSRSTVDTSVLKIMLVYILVCIGVGCTMSTAQTHALGQLPKEAYPHGIAILNTLQQISAAIGSSLFISIMSASQLKALNSAASEPVAIATGFQSATFVMVLFVLAGLFLSITLIMEKKKL